MISEVDQFEEDLKTILKHLLSTNMETADDLAYEVERLVSEARQFGPGNHAYRLLPFIVTTVKAAIRAEYFSNI